MKYKLIYHYDPMEYDSEMIPILVEDNEALQKVLNTGDLMRDFRNVCQEEVDGKASATQWLEDHGVNVLEYATFNMGCSPEG